MMFQILIALVLAVGIAGLFWWILRASAQKISEQYRKLAERFELELTVPDPAMGGFMRPEPFVHGTYRGRELAISAPGKGLQNTRQSETMVKLQVADSGLSMQMTSRGLLGKMQQRDSGQKNRWVSGDNAFDAAVDVRTNDGVRLAMILGEAEQRALLGLIRNSKATIYLGKGVLSLVEIGLIADDDTRERFEQATELLCDLAEALEA
ncbi:MAG: hypothetical protein ACPGES_07395 [Coraliomargarita sp.]